MMKFLIIQTAFTGDVVLATPVMEKLYRFFPDSQIDVLVRKGNESLFEGHPFIHSVLTFDKKNQKLLNLIRLAMKVRRNGYSHIINLHRFASSGFISAVSGAPNRIGFDKNPFSFFFTKSIKHQFGNKDHFIHETDRNLSLVEDLTDRSIVLPKLYPSPDDFQKVDPSGPYVCVAPASVWATKQFPAEKWIELIKNFPDNVSVYLIGGPSDGRLCNKIINQVNRRQLFNLAGKLTFLQSCALMQKAVMNYVNDSAPTHFASSVNAPVTTIYCSTLPEFGFTPLSKKSVIAETEQQLECRPCGIHGRKACPLGHFKCSEINIKTLLKSITK